MRRLPPEATRFKKGQSGNPKGRPKKTKGTPITSSGGGVTDRIDEFALKEAMRPVTVREGDKTEVIPAAQAVLRSMFAGAARGDAKTQRQVLDIIRSAEASRVIIAQDILEEVIRYKDKWGPKFAEAERDGKPTPNVHPHPADFEIGEDGAVTLDGPLTQEQAGALKLVEKRALRSLKEYFDTKQKLELDPDNPVLQREFEQLDALHRLLTKSGERKAVRLAYAQSLLGQEIDWYAHEVEEGEGDATQ